MKKILCLILSIVMVLGTMSFTVLAEDTDIIEVGAGKTYETLSAAAAAATDDNDDGAITYHIYGKLEISDIGWLNFRGSSNATTINFVGMDDTAEISLIHDSSDNWVQIMGTDNIKMDAINYSNLTLSKPNGIYVGDAAHQNRMFTTWMRGASTSATVTYTDCVFPNGSGNNQYGKTVYNDCEFYSENYYALWIYDAGNNLRADETPASVEVNGGKMVADRGVKIYSEEQNGTAAANTTISDCDFDIESKPAIVSSLDGTITLTDVDATKCQYGLLEMGYLNGNPKYTLADTTVDGEAVKYVAEVTATNEWGATSTIFVTDMDYAELVAEEGKKYGQGTIVNYVVKIGDTYYTNIQEAVKDAAAVASETNPVIIQLLEGEFEQSVTLPSYIDNVTFKGADNYGTVLKNSSVGHSGGMSAAMTNITFDGIDFYNSSINLTAIYENTKIENMTITNCKFHDITGKAAVSINTNSMPNLVGFTFTENTIENVGGGSFSGLVLRAAPTGDIVICNNNISNVAWNAVQLIGATADSTVTITGNTLASGASEGILNLYNISGGVVLDNNTFNTYEGQSEIGNFAAVAKVGNKSFASLSNAVAAAESGDTITLLSDVNITEKMAFTKELTIDLDGHTMNMTAELNSGLVDNDYGNCAYAFTKSVTFKNGTMNVSNANKLANDHGVFYTRYVALTFDNIDFVSNGYSSHSMFNVSGTLSFVNGTTVNVKDNAGGSSFIDANNSKVVVEDSTINISNTVRGMMNAKLEADNSKITIRNLTENALRNVSGTINDTIIDANGYASGLKNDSGTLEITGKSVVTLTGATGEGEYDLYLKAGATVAVEDTVIFEAGDVYTAEEDAITGEVTDKADSIYVQYKQVDIDADGKDTTEDSDKYEIVLVGADAEKINELASADLTFNFNGTPVTGGAMNYTVAPAEGVSLTQLGNRYMFNYDGITKYEESGLAIVIGTITIDGYGSYTLATADSDKNAVYATEIRNNIVDGFTAAGELVINKDMTADDGMVGEITNGVIKVPTRTLTINIDFPNAVNDQVIAYQDMKVEINGNIDGVNKTVTYNLGKDEKAMVDGDYVVTEDRLVLNNTYTVTVSGAGYRTARYTVTMTDNKTLNFWNNVMDEAKVVETDNDSSAKNVTFLAGDIVKDNNINIYDLSAVVSYFSTENAVTAASDYAKYDLNRDGVIDSKDVAYVLVSWDN